MPNSPAEQEPSQEEPSNSIPPEGANKQEQDGPRGHGGKTFMEHAKRR